MKHWYVWIWLAASLFIACSPGNRELDAALSLAGDNRAELQKVLDRYKNMDKDKYRAACFLIENMPFYGTYEGEAWGKYRKYFSEYVSHPYTKHVQVLIDSLKKADGEFSVNQLTYKPDITTVDSAFLVNHIEWAFKVWREQPWGKHIDFDTFREYILPYRIGDEPLSYWREEIYNRYNPLLKELKETAEADDPRAAAQVLIDTLRNAEYRHTSLFPPGPHLGPDVLKWHTGSCREFTDAVIYVLRALGIPCGIDRVLLLGDTNASHFWSFTLDKEGKTYMINLPYDEKWQKAEDYDLVKGKVYRVTYDINKEMVGELKDYPEVYPSFRRPFFHDVTAIYNGSRNWTITLPDSLLSERFHNGDLLYLCLANRLQWQPVAYTFFKDGKAHFEDVQGGAVYMLAAWNGQEYATVCQPFLLERETGKKRFILPEEGEEEVVLYRKCNLPLSILFNERMIGGVVEGSNRADFKESDTLHLIKEAPFRLHTVARLKSDKLYRYTRYKGAKDCFCNISELAFYEHMQDTVLLRGKVMGTPGSFEGNTHEYSNTFDGDVNTSFDYIHSDGGWAGLDFGRPRRVEKIIYTPRNEVNFIYEGNLYELFYWSEGEWHPIERQVATTTDSIIFSAPRAALLYLKNYTAGKDERIFEYKDGKQVFW
ncbi:MAG: transglutaminase domain-containing protein [Bacteroides sp.]|nr:transglutaminase domain-containing protein [Bacteroides sp.]